jgi:hypothetical protein
MPFPPGMIVPEWVVISLGGLRRQWLGSQVGGSQRFCANKSCWVMTTQVLSELVMQFSALRLCFFGEREEKRKK